MIGMEHAKDIRRTVEEYHTANEATFLQRFWTDLFWNTRKVPQRGPGIENRAMTDEERKELRLWSDREWEADGTRPFLHALFHQACPPISPTGDPVLDQLLKNVPKVSVPWPDIAMGFAAKAFTARELEVSDQNGFELARDAYYIYLVIEAKALGGLIGEAENQVIRGGAACVDAMERLLELTDEADHKFRVKDAYTQTNGATAAISASSSSIRTASMSFSMTVDPQTTCIYVHWAENWGAGGIDWRMEQIEQCSTNMVTSYPNLHKWIDNICDWGANVRLPAIKTCLARIAEATLHAKKRQKTKEGG